MFTGFGRVCEKKLATVSMSRLCDLHTLTLGLKYFSSIIEQ